MAVTEHYVTTGGTDTYANSTNSGTPCSLSTAFTALSGGAAAAGDRVWLKKGAYTQRSATDTLTTDGTLVSPIVVSGYNTAIGDLDTPTYNADGSLDTSNYPVIDYAATFRLNAAGSDYIIWRNVKLTSAGAGVSSALLTTGSNGVVHQCYSSNPSTNASAMCASVGTNTIVENCDFALTGASGGTAALSLGASGRAFANRVIDSQTVGIAVTSSNCVVCDNVFFAAVAGPAIAVTSTTASHMWTIRGNTIQGKTTGIQVSATTFTGQSYYADNHVTDCTTGILSLQDGTSQLPGWFSHNRFRDNTTNVDGWDDWKTGGTAGEVTTDTGGAATDYTASGSDQYRLISGAPGAGTASVPNRDIGAMQRAASGSSTLILIDDD